MSRRPNSNTFVPTSDFNALRLSLLAGNSIRLGLSRWKLEL
jgi:hypothetical protein